MKNYYYDLHIHSCLSPCGDDDSTPNNIAGMATISELNIVALTDHNTCKNCPAFFAAAEKYGIIPIAGMELTSAEDIHVICIFETLEDALKFDEFVYTKRILVKNRPEFFGEQLILDENEKIISKEEFLLSNATALSLEEILPAVRSFGGVAYPAHIDREANGIVAILGTIPKDTEYRLFELNSREKLDEYAKLYGIPKENFIISSDAHTLEGIRDKENYFTLPDGDANEVRYELFKILRKVAFGG